MATIGVASHVQFGNTCAAVVNLSAGSASNFGINYTGAVVSPPTGFTIFQLNANGKIAVNAASQPAGPALTGAISTDDAFNLMPVGSIAAGTWVITIAGLSSTGTLGPTVKVGVKAWKSNSDGTSVTQIFDWTYGATYTAAQTNYAITVAGVGAQTFSGSQVYVYFEFILDVTVGGSNVIVNTISSTNVIGFTSVPSIGFSRNPAETITSASDAPTRALVQARTVSETITAASDTPTRQYNARRTVTESATAANDSATRFQVLARTVTESVTAASDTPTRVQVLARIISESITAANDSVARVYHAFRTVTENVTAANDAPTRIAQFNRAISETITSATDTVSRMFAGARLVTENITAANDSVARVFQANRTITETISSGGGGTTIIPIFVFDD
jgi:hypothetical protein